MRKILFVLMSIALLTIGLSFNANAQSPRHHGRGGHHGRPHHVYQQYGPMDVSTFDTLCANIKKAKWYDEQYDYISKALAHGHVFSVAQTVYLLKLFDNYVTQEKVSLMIYPTVYDRQNWYQVYNIFTNHYWREDVKYKIAEIDRNRS